MNTKQGKNTVLLPPDDLPENSKEFPPKEQAIESSALDGLRGFCSIHIMVST